MPIQIPCKKVVFNNNTELLQFINQVWSILYSCSCLTFQFNYVGLIVKVMKEEYLDMQFCFVTKKKP
jgi:hypothetical protein